MVDEIYEDEEDELDNQEEEEIGTDYESTLTLRRKLESLLEEKVLRDELSDLFDED